MINTLKFYYTKNTYPYRNLAVEEYLTTHVQDDEIILYLWQNSNTIVIGRNQNAWKECRVSELEKDGGHVVRRLSGGGAVYHDLGNLNFTFCVKKANYSVDKQLDVILEAVKDLGINAQKTGRNDITIDGKKFSGNAFYKTGDCCYHHGTLLLNVDTAMMTKYLNVDIAKLQAKGVDSVKSRVTNLNAYYPNISVDLMTKKLQNAFDKVYKGKSTIISQDNIDTAKIDVLEQNFADWNWIFGRKIPFTHKIQKRFSWGDIEIYLFVDSGKIEKVNIYSDMMEQDFILRLKKKLPHTLYKKDAIMEKIKQSFSHDISSQIQQDVIDLIETEI